MRILIHGINYTPELTGIGKYTGEMAEWLALQGHEIRVVTAPPYYPAWKVTKEYSAWQYKKEFINRVTVFRCPLWVPNKQKGMNRLLHLASFAFFSLPVMLLQFFWRPDVVIVIEPPFFCAPQGWLIARLSGAKSWLHIQDFEIDAAFALGLLPSGPIRSFVTALESRVMRRFDRVFAISKNMANHLIVGKQVPAKRVCLFPNWTDIEDVKYDSEKARLFRRKYGFNERQFLVLYSGNMGEKQGLEVVIDVAERIKAESNIRFILCGEGAAKSRLQNIIRERSLSNIVFLPLQSKETFVGMLSAADIHLVIQKANAADLVLPSKLANILAVGGVSVVTAKDDTELGHLASDYPGVIRLCPPDNAAELADIIISFNSKPQAKEIPNSLARWYAEEFLAKEKILGKFCAELQQLNNERI